MAGQRVEMVKRRKRERKSWQERLKDEASKAEGLAEEVLENRDLLPETLNGFFSANARTRFKSAKIVRIISERNPRLLYPRMDFFIDLLDSENNILRWIALDVIANLTFVDSKNEFDKVFKKYHSYLMDESMVTAGHVVDNSGKIAEANPHLQRRITTELLKVETIPRGQECKNILLAKVIVAFGRYVGQVKNKGKMISLAKRQLSNSRNATRMRAEEFLKRFGETSID